MTPSVAVEPRPRARSASGTFWEDLHCPGRQCPNPRKEYSSGQALQHHFIEQHGSAYSADDPIFEALRLKKCATCGTVASLRAMTGHLCPPEEQPLLSPRSPRRTPRSRAQTILPPNPPSLGGRDSPRPPAVDFSLLILSSLDVPTFEHLPTALANRVANAYADVITQYIELPNAVTLRDLQMFPASILARRRTQDEPAKPAQLLNRRLNLWSEPEGRRALWAERLSSALPKQQRQVDPVRRALQLAWKGAASKAQRVLDSRGTASVSEETFQRLQSMFAERPLPTPQPALPSFIPPAITEQMIIAAVKDLPAQRAAGPDLLRPEALKDMVADIEENRLPSALARLATTMTRGLLPQEHAVEFLSTMATPIIKNELGDLRPIEIPTVLFTVIDKVAFNLRKRALGEYLQPRQLGVAAKNGGDAMVHFLKEKERQLGQRPDLVRIDVDVKQAFPSIRRQVVLDASRRIEPHWYPWVLWKLAGEHCSYYHGRVLRRTTGGAQGSPGFPGEFALGIGELLKEFSEECAQSLLAQVWWFDDGKILVPAASYERVLLALVRCLRKADLEPNATKLKLFPNAPLPPLSEAARQELGFVPRVAGPDDVFEAGGVPIFGAPNAIAAWFEKKASELTRKFDNVQRLPNHPALWVATQTCVDSPVNHLKRTCFNVEYDGAFHRLLRIDHDLQAMRRFDHFKGSSSDPDTRLQIQLPRAMGGFGWRSAEAGALAAFISGCANAAPLVSRLLGVERWVHPQLAAACEAFNQQLHPTLADKQLVAQNLAPETQQKALQELVDRTIQKRLYQAKTEPHDRARLLSLTMPHAAAWLDALPTKANSFSDKGLAALINFRLGTPVLASAPLAGERCSRCRAVLTPDGAHAAICAAGDYTRNTKHAVVRDALAEIARDSGVLARIEVTLPMDDSDQRPADVFLPSFIDGRAVALDASIVSPHVANILGEAAVHKGAAAARQEAEKVRRYHAHCQALSVEYRPAVLEIYGGWGEEGLRVLKLLARRYATMHKVEHSVAIQRLVQRVAIAMMRYTAAMIGERHHFAPPDRDRPYYDA